MREVSGSNPGRTYKTLNCLPAHFHMRAQLSPTLAGQGVSAISNTLLYFTLLFFNYTKCGLLNIQYLIYFLHVYICEEDDMNNTDMLQGKSHQSESQFFLGSKSETRTRNDLHYSNSMY